MMVMLPSGLIVPNERPRPRTEAETVAAREAYRALHQCCPVCRSRHVCQTTAYSVVLPGQSEFANNNRATCGCGWSGIVDDLVEVKG